MENALPWNATDNPPEPRETAHVSGSGQAIAAGDGATENLALTEGQRDAAIGRLYQALRAMAQRIDNAERSQSQAVSAMSLTTQEINAAALDQAQAFHHLATRIELVERHAEPRAIRDEVERVREALGPHLAAIERKLEHFGAWVRQAEELSQPDPHLEEILRSFGDRIDATEQKTSTMLGELQTSLGEMARRLEALEHSMPLAGAPVQPLGPTRAELARRSDLPPIPDRVLRPDGHAETMPVPATAAASTSEQQPVAMPKYFLGQARLTAQAAIETDAERGGGWMRVLRLPRMQELLPASDGQAEQPRRLSRHAAMVAAVLLLATAAMLMTGNTGDRREAPTPKPANRIALQKSAGGGSPNFDGAALPSSPQPPEPLSGTLLRLMAQAATGDTKAALALGIKYADGDGVPEDNAEAARWLAEAAVAGEPVAQYRFGTLYEKGLGVSADPRQAVSWYGEAARHGNRKAMHNLALLYADGTGGPKSYTEAVRWFRAAAELGVTDSQFNLAVLYERGWGVPASLSEAYKWYAIAAAGGDAESKARIDALASEIPEADRRAAENGAKAFIPRPMDVAAN
jgi:TPR repeat protein